MSQLPICIVSILSQSLALKPSSFFVDFFFSCSPYPSSSFFFYFIEVWLAYNIILVSSVQHGDLTLHTLQNGHHYKSSYHLSSHKVNTVLWSIFPMLHVTSLWPVYFITGSLYFLIPFTHFAFSQPPPFWEPLMFHFVCFAF